MPFEGIDQLSVYMSILMKEPEFPDFVEDSSKMFIEHLLVKDQTQRLTKGYYIKK